MNETVIETSHKAADEQSYIDRIDSTLSSLSLERLKEVSDFASFLADKERRHKEFVEETLAAEQEEGYTFDTVEEAMEFIKSWKE
ncbi:hypothetical protein [Candidatus Magnetomonas plexicatena]|uniref:hypothetical protein n=1 Tax=Candidatus Magnetomonas plexicatena TaxID=2552947 RepID=UPI001101BF92|nr:hypothetical protein E2O03_010640 [Nitrospirales bacterium LBB_01]